MAASHDKGTLNNQSSPLSWKQEIAENKFGPILDLVLSYEKLANKNEIASICLDMREGSKVDYSASLKWYHQSNQVEFVKVEDPLMSRRVGSRI